MGPDLKYICWGAVSNLKCRRLYGIWNKNELCSNVCLIKIRSKHSSNTLLCLLRIFMKQTLSMCRCMQQRTISQWTIHSENLFHSILPEICTYVIWCMDLNKELVSNVSHVHQFTQVYSKLIKKSVLLNFKTSAFIKNVAYFSVKSQIL